MKNLKLFHCILAFLILLQPLITSAKDEIIDTLYKHKRVDKQKIKLYRPNQLFEATMYLTINFDLMRKQGVFKIYNDKKLEFITDIFGDMPSIPDEYSHLYFYSSGKKYDINIIVDGHFKNMSILNHVRHILENNKNITKILSVKSQLYKKGRVHIFKVKMIENNKSIVKKIYLSEINNSKFVVSFNVFDAKDWMMQPIAEFFNNLLHENKIVQFIFTVQKTIENMKKSNNVDNYMFQSLVLNELDTLHFTVSVNDKKLYIGASLTANDENKAKKVSQIINGILAIKQLSEGENRQNKIIINNAINIQTNNYIQIGSYIPLNELTKIKNQ